MSGTPLECGLWLAQLALASWLMGSADLLLDAEFAWLQVQGQDIVHCECG